MNTTFKSFVASAVLAVSALGIAALSTPAKADLRWNGPLLQGISLQGISLNGPILQGIRLNGPVFQGTQTTGAAQTGRILAVSLPGGEVIDLR